MGCIIMQDQKPQENISLSQSILEYSLEQQEQSTIKEHNQIQQPQESIRRDFISKHVVSRNSENIFEDSSNQTIKELISQFQKNGDKRERHGTTKKRKKQKGISMRSLELQF